MKLLLRFLLLVCFVILLVFFFIRYATAAQRKNDEYIPLGLRAAATRVCALWGFKDIRCRNDLLAIARQESNFNPLAQGDWSKEYKRYCSGGLMQINTCGSYGKYIHPSMIWDPEKAMYVAFDYLVVHGYPQKREFAIRAYNCGYDLAQKKCGTSYYFWVDTFSHWYEYPIE